MNTVTIPASIEEATKALKGVGALLTAKEWERAAIVYAFTEPTDGGRPKAAKSGEKSPLTIAAFAALGITGLTTRNTVREYRETWQKYGSPVQPGDTITLPDLDWPPIDHGRGSHATSSEIRAAIVKNPGIVVEAAKAVPAVADAVVEAAVVIPGLSNRVESEATYKRLGLKKVDFGEPVTPALDPTDLAAFRKRFDRQVQDALSVLDEALRKEEADEWAPEAGTAVMLLAMGLRLTRRVVPASLFDEIDAFLAKEVK